MWDLPGPGLEPVSSALTGGFLTTAPPALAPFIGERYLETKIWVLGGLIFIGVSLIPALSSDRAGNQHSFVFKYI